jgi:hypothetical protein
MTLAEQQHRAHIERQKRLGKGVPPARPLTTRLDAPPLSPQSEPAPAPAQARTIETLEQEVAQLSAQLEAMAREDQSPLVDPSRIKPVVSAVAKYYGVSLRDLVSFRRTTELIRPRQVAMYLAKQLTKHSLPTIGRVLDRDHTTVLHGCRRIATLRRQDKGLDGEITALVERLMPGGRPPQKPSPS